jgi:hypothetical protein
MNKKSKTQLTATARQKYKEKHGHGDELSLLFLIYKEEYFLFQWY